MQPWRVVFRIPMKADWRISGCGNPLAPLLALAHSRPPKLSWSPSASAPWDAIAAKASQPAVKACARTMLLIDIFFLPLACRIIFFELYTKIYHSAPTTESEKHGTRGLWALLDMLILSKTVHIQALPN